MARQLSEKQLIKKDLSKYYEKVVTCSRCKTIYGVDKTKDNKLCPKCMRTLFFGDEDD